MGKITKVNKNKPPKQKKSKAKKTEKFNRLKGSPTSNKMKNNNDSGAENEHLLNKQKNKKFKQKMNPFSGTAFLDDKDSGDINKTVDTSVKQEVNNKKRKQPAENIDCKKIKTEEIVIKNDSEEGVQDVNDSTKAKKKHKNKKLKKEEIVKTGLNDSKKGGKEVNNSVKNEKKGGNKKDNVKTENSIQSKNTKVKTKRQKRRMKLKQYKQRVNEIKHKLSAGGEEADVIAAKLKEIISGEKPSTELLISVDCAKQLLYFHEFGDKNQKGEVKAAEKNKTAGKKNAKNNADKSKNIDGGKLSPKKNSNENKSATEDKKIKKNETETKHVLFIGNLPYNCTAADLKAHFSEVCAVKHVRIPLKEGTDKPKGIAFLEVENEDSVQKALTLHESELQNRKINVMQSKGGRKKKSKGKSG